MNRVAPLTQLFIGGCVGFEISRPVDIEVEAVGELPELEPGTQIEVTMFSTSKAAVVSSSHGPDCLEDGGACEFTVDVAGLGNKDVELYAWLDVDGNDGSDLEKAILDGDPLGYLFIHIPALPYDGPQLVVLDDPALIVDGEVD